MLVHAQINSPFGCYDGNVYERYFARVKASNPHNPVPPCEWLSDDFQLPPGPDSGRHPCLADFERVIKPLIDRQPLELVDDVDSIELDDEIAEIKAERDENEKERQAAQQAKKAERTLQKPESA